MLTAGANSAKGFESFTANADSQLAWRQIAEPVEPFLLAVAGRLQDQVTAFDPEIATYARYAISNQGKQIRPVLVGLSASAAGRLEDAHITAAVIIEMVHLATLVHDDIVDEANLRRGRPTLASNWGNEISVLLGDCLFAHALVLAAGFPTTEVCRAVASATNTVCSGEILQTQRRQNFQFSQAEYFKILGMKTGELFALACDMGAFLSGAPGPTRTALREYGMALGTAYQIYDDCVDLFGTEAEVGKSLGTDLITGKLTLPVIFLLESLPVAERTRWQEQLTTWDASQLDGLQKLLRQHQALPRTQAVIRRYLEHARSCLKGLPGQSGTGLGGLADLLERMAHEFEEAG